MKERLAYASSIQLGLWLLDQLTGGAPIHNLPYAYRLRGHIDIDAMRKAFAIVVKRHEILQSVLQFKDGELFQGVSSHAVAELQRKTLKPAEYIEGILSDLGKQHFDLYHGPLWFACLIELGTDDHILCLVFHHAVFDGLSMGVFLKELSDAYCSLVTQQTLHLSGDVVQYAQQSEVERSYLARHLARHLPFWRRELHAVTPLNLPTNMARPSVQTFQGKRSYFTIDSEVFKAAKQLASQVDATVFNVFLAGFFGLLFRYVQQEDLILGVPVASRTRKGTRSAIGPYVNLLPVRIRVADTVSFSDLVRLVKRALTGVYLHSQVPFETLVEEFGPRRDPSRNGLIDVFFQY